MRIEQQIAFMERMASRFDGEEMPAAILSTLRQQSILEQRNAALELALQTAYDAGSCKCDRRSAEVPQK